MAKRPIFIPQSEGQKLVLEKMIEFTWNPGFAPIQKKKNIVALHAAAEEKKISPLLEVSTKSDQILGIQLSAFNLQIALKNGKKIPIECAFQGSKVFKDRGPYDDIFWKRMFSSTITMEANVANRRINEYMVGLDALLEAERIKAEIFNIEHDLWEY